MNKKQERELYGPSWTEVILGAVLSLLLGIGLAFVFLVMKPVTTVKEMPTETVVGTVYYVEGSRDAGKGRQAAAKQKSFLEGQSVVLTEDELNQIVAPPPAPAAKKAATAEPAQTVASGSPNFRIRDGVMQIGLPLRLNVLGFEQRVIVQARGGFEKRGDVFVFDPSELYLGSCPLQRIPAVQGMLMKRFRASLAVPEELAAAWSKLSAVDVEGSTLKLTM
ncbi:MAG TPA: hypothetical protein VEQ65_09050 [Opitutus sp.]|nr:hypothetical protein [Opitutus sp.]